MATVSKWNPFGVSLDLEATAGAVTRISATQFTVQINASWETYYNGAETNYGMDVSSGGAAITLNKFGGYHSNGSGTLVGTYSISGNTLASKTITVTFVNYNSDNGKTASKDVSLTVSVPAWTSYTVSYSANGGSGAPASQTKWKDQPLTLSSSKPTLTGYSFQGWATSATGGVAYTPGGTYDGNASITLFAVWKSNTYTVSYNANGGSGAPSSQTKIHGVTLTLSSIIPTKTNYRFKGWGISASATTVSYTAGSNYTSNASITLYAIWELAYTQPRISNLSVTRCDSEGIATIDGTYCLVNFSWACDKSVIGIAISWKTTTASSYDSTVSVTASGTSGTVNTIVGGSLAATLSYSIAVAVADTMGRTALITTLSSMMFSIHAKPGGTGIAFGKTQELDNRAEFGWDIELNGHTIYNNGEAPFAPVGYGLGSSPTTVSDLNACLTNGWYLIGPDTINAPSDLIYSAVHVCTRMNYQIVQRLFGMNTNSGCQMIRYSLNGGKDWTEEWVNPPLNVGLEYRTTERWYSYPVYIKMIDMGALPNNTVKSISVSDHANSGRIISATGFENASGQAIPTSCFGSSLSNVVGITFSAFNLSLVTNFDGSPYTQSFITVKYIKY